MYTVLSEGRCLVSAVTVDTEPGWERRLKDWVESYDLVRDPQPQVNNFPGFRPAVGRMRFKSGEIFGSAMAIGAYAPARALSYIGTLAEMKTPTYAANDCLAFEFNGSE